MINRELIIIINIIELISISFMVGFNSFNIFMSLLVGYFFTKWLTVVAVMFLFDRYSL